MQTNLTWLMDKLREVPGVRHVLLLSTDGLVRSADSGLGRDEADGLAASACGLLATGGQVNSVFGIADPVRTVAVDLDPHHLLVMGAGSGSALAVLADLSGPAADLGAVATEMGRLVERLPEQLSTPSRHGGGVGPS
ncbi:roadblock/LC7 domain-containing protein [Nocardiopsis nanhaiensis]